MKMVSGSIPLKALERGFTQLKGIEVQVAYDESLLAVSVMFDKPGFVWTRLLRDFGDAKSFETTIKSFGWSYSALEAPFAR